MEGIWEGSAPTRFAVRCRERRASLKSIGTGVGVTEGIREGSAPTRFAVRRRERRASLGSIAGGTGFGK
jgi:hypothetical protein